MTAAAQPPTPGHAFLSYVHEDSDQADRLQELLEASGVQVWRDKDDLWPGQDWQLEIARAIKTGSLAFLACFSSNSEARASTYQNEELILAVEEMRLRAPGRQWFFPVRFSECKLPDYSLGAGRDLNSLQRSDLFGPKLEVNTSRLVTAVVRLLDASTTPASQKTAYAEDPVGFMKATLLDPTKQIQLDDFVNTRTRETIDRLCDADVFPMTMPADTDPVSAVRLAAAQARRYWETVQPLADILIAGCRWGRPEHEELWSRTLRAVANRQQEISGRASLLGLQRLPSLALMYAASLSAVDRRNYGALRAVTIDPLVRPQTGREALPLISSVHPHYALEDQTAATILALGDDEPLDDAAVQMLMSGQRGRRKTGLLDFLNKVTRDRLKDQVSSGDFEDLFDRTEALLGALATDDFLQAQEKGGWRDGPWYGRSVWKHGHVFGQGVPEVELLKELEEAGPAWPPLGSGLFGSSAQRATAALESFATQMQTARRNRW